MDRQTLKMCPNRIIFVVLISMGVFSFYQPGVKADANVTELVNVTDVNTHASIEWNTTQPSVEPYENDTTTTTEPIITTDSNEIDITTTTTVPIITTDSNEIDITNTTNTTTTGNTTSNSSKIATRETTYAITSTQGPHTTISAKYTPALTTQQKVETNFTIAQTTEQVEYTTTFDNTTENNHTNQNKDSDLTGLPSVNNTLPTLSPNGTDSPASNTTGGDNPESKNESSESQTGLSPAAKISVIVVSVVVGVLLVAGGAYLVYRKVKVTKGTIEPLEDGDDSLAGGPSGERNIPMSKVSVS